MTILVSVTILVIVIIFVIEGFRIEGIDKFPKKGPRIAKKNSIRNLAKIALIPKLLGFSVPRP